MDTSWKWNTNYNAAKQRDQTVIIFSIGSYMASVSSGTDTKPDKTARWRETTNSNTTLGCNLTPKRRMHYLAVSLNIGSQTVCSSTMDGLVAALRHWCCTHGSAVAALSGSYKLPSWKPGMWYSEFVRVSVWAHGTWTAGRGSVCWN